MIKGYQVNLQTMFPLAGKVDQEYGNTECSPELSWFQFWQIHLLFLQVPEKNQITSR